MTSSKIKSERTLVFILDESNLKILLALKKQRQGAGYYNGFGGKKEADETIEEAAVREVLEESKLKIKKEDLEKVAEIEFYFPAKPEWNQRVHIYFCKKWQGSPVETEEMKPEWFNIKDMPYHNMWKSDTTWLPIVLSGKKIKAVYQWKEDNKTVDQYEIEEVKLSD